nr:hypothetical protein CFP56_73721 [Quercus suber]
MSRVLSKEEEAELARSNKKVKDFNHAEFNEGSRATSPLLGNRDWGSNTKPSFKDKLVGEIPGAFAQAFDLADQMEEDLVSDEESSETSNFVREGQVKITLSKETKKHIRGPWSKAVIVKLVGLNELPIELHETEVLKELGESNGKVLRIDSYTALEARGRYARLCVQIDINRLIVNSILIGLFEQVVTMREFKSCVFRVAELGIRLKLSHSLFARIRTRNRKLRWRKL